MWFWVCSKMHLHTVSRDAFLDKFFSKMKWISEWHIWYDSSTLKDASSDVSMVFLNFDAYIRVEIVTLLKLNENSVSVMYVREVLH